MDNRKHLIEKSLAEKKCVDDNQYYYQQETEMVPVIICRITVYPRKNLMVIRGHNLTAPWLLMTSLTAHRTLVLKYLAWIFEAVLSDISKTSAFVKKT